MGEVVKTTFPVDLRKEFQNSSKVVHFCPLVVTLGAQMRPNVVTRLGAKLTLKAYENGVFLFDGLVFLGGTCLQDGSKRPPGDPQTLKIMIRSHKDVFSIVFYFSSV